MQEFYYKFITWYVWWLLAFVPHLTSSPLTKFGNIYIQILKEEKIFPLTPRSEWSAQWSLKYAENCLEFLVKNLEQNLPQLHLATPQEEFPITMVLSRKFLDWKKAQKNREKIEDRQKSTTSLKMCVTFLSSSQNFDFCTCPNRNVIKRGMKGMLSCSKCLFKYMIRR